MIITLTPEEAAVAEHALEELRSLAEAMPPLDENDEPVAPYALPACRAAELDFTDCPGWTLAELLGLTEEGGRTMDALPASQAEVRSLHQKLLEAIVAYVQAVPSL
jgi:hypothetical protein